MITTREMTAKERQDVLYYQDFHKRLIGTPLKTSFQTFTFNFLGVGILAIGFCHFLVGFFYELTFPVKAILVIGIALIISTASYINVICIKKAP